MKRVWLKKIREEKGMLQKDVASEIGVASSTYAMYEQGNRTPSVATAAKIGMVLNFDWQLFFEEQLHETCTEKLA